MKNILDSLSREDIFEIVKQFGMPTFVYSEDILEKAAFEVLNFPQEFGLTVRYAMKTLPTKRVLTIFNNL